MHPSGINPGILNLLIGRLFPFWHLIQMERAAKKWWNSVLHRVRQKYGGIYFAILARNLLSEGQVIQSVPYLLAGAQAILAEMRRVRKYPQLVGRRDLFRFCDGTLTKLRNMVFAAMTEEATHSLTIPQIQVILEEFSSSYRMNDLRMMQKLLQGEDSLTADELNLHPFSSKDVRYLSIGLFRESHKDWVGAILAFREVKDTNFRWFSLFRAAVIMRDGKGGQAYQRDKGKTILEQLRTRSYRPAMLEHLKRLYERATTPENVAEAFEYALSVKLAEWQPKFMANLLTRLTSQTKNLKRVMRDWEDSASEQQQKLIELMDPEGPRVPPSRLDAVTARLGFLKEGLKRAQAELQSAETISADLRARWNEEKKKLKQESKLGIKRRREE